MIDLAESGYFMMTVAEMNAYLNHPQGQAQEMPPDLTEAPPKIKLTPPDKTFLDIKEYLNLSGARKQSLIVLQSSHRDIFFISV